ncbi:Y-family DNA polymerase [Rhodovibrionaceae bacterium A322]
MKRVISIWLPNFSLDRLVSRQAPTFGQPSRSTPEGAGSCAAEGTPFAQLQQEGNRFVLTAVAPDALAAGVRPGMTLADGRALCPALKTQPADPAGNQAALEKLADWLGRYSPWVALDPEGGGPSLQEGSGGGAGLWLDITGCAHLFGGEEALCEDLVARLQRFGLTVSVGLAETPGAAWALARYATSAARPWQRISAGQEKRHLVDLPVSALRVPLSQVEVLARLGLTRLGELLKLPAASLEPRVGPEVTRRLQEALGLLPEALSPRRPVSPHLVRQVFAEPLLGPEALARTLDRLLQDLSEKLEALCAGARRLELCFYRSDGQVPRLRVGTGRPSRDPAHLARLFRDKLERLDPGFGLDAMTLEAVQLERLDLQQLGLVRPALQARRGSEGKENGALAARASCRLPELLDRLTSRLGEGSVGLALPRESHLPEEAVRRTDPYKRPGDKIDRRGNRIPLSWPRRQQPRPVRLLVQPEAIEALAELPDQAPVQFRWRRVLHRVVRAEGPERISPEWWQQAERQTRRKAAAPVAARQASLPGLELPGEEPAQPERPSLDRLSQQDSRDYFRVEDEDGRRFWLFRSEQNWFLQGLFA